MTARRLIEGSLYGPQTLQVMFEAFDQAWLEIAHHFGDAERDVEQARRRLAHAILSVTMETSTEAEQVKKDALLVMALAYKDRGWAADRVPGPLASDRPGSKS